MTLLLAATLLVAASSDGGVEAATSSIPVAASTPDAGTAITAAPAAAVKKGNYLRLAAPAFSGVNLDDKVAAFFSEHFASALVQRGVLVMTPSEINAMIGLERTKQLAGCAEDGSNCIAELSNALGVDGLVAGTVAKFGGTVQANIKVFNARDGSAIKAVSLKSGSEEQLLEALSAQAAELAPELLVSTRKDRAPTALKEPEKGRLNAVTVNPTVFAGQYGFEFARTLYPWLVAYAEPRLTRVRGRAGLLQERLERRQDLKDFDNDGFQVALGARLYWPGPARGFFGAAQLELGSGSETLRYNDGRVDATTNRGTKLAVGLMIGHTWMIYDMIPLTIGVGGSYGLLDYEPGGLFIQRFNTGFAF